MNPEFRGQTVCCKMQLEFETLATPPAIARERAAGGPPTNRVSFAHPTLLAKKRAQSGAVCRDTSLLKNSRDFTEA